MVPVLLCRHAGTRWERLLPVGRFLKTLSTISLIIFNPSIHRSIRHRLSARISQANANAGHACRTDARHGLGATAVAAGDDLTSLHASFTTPPPRDDHGFGRHSTPACTNPAGAASTPGNT